jgi:hypothetical protein
MQQHKHFTRLVLTTALLAASVAAQAQESTLNLNLPSPLNARATDSFLLAANDVAAPSTTAAASITTPQAPFEPAWISGSNTHLVLGLATIVAAGLTAVTAPEGCEGSCVGPQPPREVNGAHAKLAKATVALAAATITSGVLFHWDDFHLEDGFTDPDNLHIILGISGAALMAYAVNKSAKSSVEVSHAGVAELGALGMVAAIKLTW